MAKHNELGKMGEEKAIAYLEEHHYTIRDRNWRYRHLELDIIAEKENMLVVIEVKTRKNDLYKKASEAVDRSKINNTIKATNQYLIENKIDLETRFDIITVVNNKITHYKEAFHAPLCDL